MEPIALLRPWRQIYRYRPVVFSSRGGKGWAWVGHRELLPIVSQKSTRSRNRQRRDAHFLEYRIGRIRGRLFVSRHSCVHIVRTFFHEHLKRRPTLTAQSDGVAPASCRHVCRAKTVGEMSAVEPARRRRYPPRGTDVITALKNYREGKYQKAKTKTARAQSLKPRA